jgi:hypothetical protein
MAKKTKNKAKPEQPVKKQEARGSLEKRAIDIVLDSKEESLSFYQEKFKLFNYFDRLYIKGAAKTNVPYGRANLELPLAFQQVEPFVSQMLETMAGEAPIIAYSGRTQADDEIAPALTDYAQYQLDNGGFVPAYTQYLRNLAKYGTAVMKLPWEYITKTLTSTHTEPSLVTDEMGNPQFDANGQPLIEDKEVTVEEEVVVHDGPKFYTRSIYDFLVPRSATSCDIQKLDWCIDRSWRELDDLSSASSSSPESLL